MYSKLKLNLKMTALALATAAAGHAHALGAGDLSFTTFNADEDGWAMVALGVIGANTSVFFTDNEWGGSSFNTGESHHIWNTGGSDIAAGTVIRFSAIDNAANLAASTGSLARQAVTGSSNYGMSASEETVYAYLGASATAPTTFLAAITSGTFGSASAGSLANTGLSIGNGAIQLSSGTDFAEYAGTRSGQVVFADYKPLVATVANWNDLGGGSFGAVVPNTSAFSVSAVPEPETYALLLVGLGLIGTIARRRRAV